jgi:hypothetical protein
MEGVAGRLPLGRIGPRHAVSRPNNPSAGSAGFAWGAGAGRQEESLEPQRLTLLFEVIENIDAAWVSLRRERKV